MHREVAVELGDPANVILDFAQRNDIDRIILCSHGRTGVSRWVHGSVARKVLEAADRTVVLVRAALPKAAGVSFKEQMNTVIDEIPPTPTAPARIIRRS